MNNNSFKKDAIPLLGYIFSCENKKWMQQITSFCLQKIISYQKYLGSWDLREVFLG